MSGSRWVDVLEMARRSVCLESRIPIERLPRLASVLSHPGATISARLKGGVDAQGRSTAVLELKGRLGLICDRCGQSIDWALDCRAAFFFVADQASLDALPITVDDDEPLVGSRHFDWWDLVEDQAILSLPISPRHANCVCPDRHREGDGAPAAPEERRPFDVLRAFKKR